MNLEQAIRRTKAVIGLPFSERSGQCYIDWETLTIVDDGASCRLSKQMAFSLLRDHVHEALMRKRCFIEHQPEENRYMVADCLGNNPQYSSDALDAMLLKLEALEGERQ